LFNQLLKIDILQHKVSRWYEQGCYPGEPIFVPQPKSEQEDEGVILSVVLDGNQGDYFLLILDGHSFFCRNSQNSSPQSYSFRVTWSIISEASVG